MLHKIKNNILSIGNLLYTIIMNMGIIIVIAIAGIWALGIFLGAIGGLSKTFTHTPAAMDSSDIQRQEQKTIDDTQEKQKELMDNMKQKMEDAAQKDQ
jgi:hypothetical protein